MVTIDREKRLNSIPTQGHTEGEAIWSWLDNEPTLRVGIITGRGTRSFCAGADLIEQNEKQKVRKLKLDAGKDASEPSESLLSASGFAGLSQRRGKKPVIAAVNGFALGGGFEICLNWFVFSTTTRANSSMHMAIILYPLRGAVCALEFGGLTFRLLLFIIVTW